MIEDKESLINELIKSDPIDVEYRTDGYHTSWFIENEMEQRSNMFLVSFDTPLITEWDIISCTYPSFSDEYIAISFRNLHADIKEIKQLLQDEVEITLELINGFGSPIERRKLKFDTLSIRPLLNYGNCDECGEWIIVGKITSQANYPIQSKETSDK